MKTLNFRTLTAGEIDCRIATVKESGISLLLYKDARVDQNILDEVVFMKEGRLLLQTSVEEIREEKGKSVDAYFREVFAC